MKVARQENRPRRSSAMLDAKAYQAHFPDDPAYDGSGSVEPPRLRNSAALLEALAALEIEFRTILKSSSSEC
jgi:hypothetical protein